MPEERHRRDTGDSTRLMRRLDEYGERMPAWQRTVFQATGCLMILTPLARFVVFDVLGVGKHEHESTGWVDVAQVIVLEYGASLAIMWVGLMLLFPPVMALTLMGIRRLLFRNGKK